MLLKFATFGWIELTHLTRADEQQRKWRRGHCWVREDSWAPHYLPYPTLQGMKSPLGVEVKGTKLKLINHVQRRKYFGTDINLKTILIIIINKIKQETGQKGN